MERRIEFLLGELMEVKALLASEKRISDYWYKKALELQELVDDGKILPGTPDVRD